jgi:hypothetical protein
VLGSLTPIFWLSRINNDALIMMPQGNVAVRKERTGIRWLE